MPRPLNPLNWDTRSSYDSIWRSIGEFAVEMLKVAAIAFAIIIPVRYFLIQPFYVKGASMEPNFYDHEYLIIDELSYRFDDPARGDIVVFRYPKDPQQYFIKRVIALPGETIKIKDGTVFIYNEANPNGIAIEEKYLPDDRRTNGSKDLILGEDEYFLLGDNRDFSLDSRSFGPVPQRLIIGKVWFRGWPFNRATIFNSPVYNMEVTY